MFGKLFGDKREVALDEVMRSKTHTADHGNGDVYPESIGEAFDSAARSNVKDGKLGASSQVRIMSPD